MTYHFKPLDELYWSVITSGATVLLLALVSFDPDKVTDWRAWAVALGAGMLRSMAGAALDYLRRSMTDAPAEPPSPPLTLEAIADELERRRRARIEERLRQASEGAR